MILFIEEPRKVKESKLLTPTERAELLRNKEDYAEVLEESMKNSKKQPKVNKLCNGLV